MTGCYISYNSGTSMLNAQSNKKTTGLCLFLLYEP